MTVFVECVRLDLENHSKCPTIQKQHQARSQFQFKASEIPIIFDHPNRHGISPKDIERSRRDHNCKKIIPGTCTCISDKTDLPKTNWRNFLSDRVQKRNLVNFLSEKFLELVQSKLHDKS